MSKRSFLINFKEPIYLPTDNGKWEPVQYMKAALSEKCKMWDDDKGNICLHSTDGKITSNLVFDKRNVLYWGILEE